ncbi:glycosyltransferase family 2 protein [Clostridium sp.]|uniref:glycosyltransferase family 2 protein n=1 Tax=Clostridium sp. TaxID=1506 RepID=UPI003D6CBEE9
MADITAIILTKNESRNIVECLLSIRDFVDRAVVIDCGSTDNTVELAKKYGADVYFHEFEYYAKQFNWALDNTDIKIKWVIRIDADERFPEKLCKEISINMALHDNDDVNGFTIEAWYYFMGKCLKHGGSKKRKMMVFKHGIGRIEDRKRDAHSILSSGRAIALKEKFLHYDFKDLDNFVSKYNWYATREMQDFIAYENGKLEQVIDDKDIYKQRKKKYGIYYKTPMFLRAWMLFIYNYIFRGGFLDGRQGYIYHVLSSFWYRYLVDAKIYEHLKTGNEIEKLKALGD